MKIPDSMKGKWIPYGTFALAAVNILYFFFLLICGATGRLDRMIEYGALFTSNGVYEGSIWQIFVSMFMHFDIYHLGSNLLLLVIIGEMLERGIGAIRILISYLLCGLAGNLATIAVYGVLGKTAVSAGASGAVFGLVGIQSYFLLRNRTALSGIHGSRILFMIFLMLYNGFGNPRVNNTAHVSGLLAGLILGVLFYRSWKSRQNDREGSSFS